MKTIMFGQICIQLGLVLNLMSGAIASDGTHDKIKSVSHPMQPIDQPISHKVAVTLGGVGLIGAELWWFVQRKPTARRAATQDGTQEVSVVVDGGYEPSQVIVQAGHLVRLNFDRKDPSSCLEEIPDSIF